MIKLLTHDNSNLNSQPIGLPYLLNMNHFSFIFEKNKKKWIFKQIKHFLFFSLELILLGPSAQSLIITAPSSTSSSSSWTSWAQDDSFQSNTLKMSFLCYCCCCCCCCCCSNMYNYIQIVIHGKNLCNISSVQQRVVRMYMPSSWIQFDWIELPQNVGGKVMLIFFFYFFCFIQFLLLLFFFIRLLLLLLFCVCVVVVVVAICTITYK